MLLAAIALAHMVNWPPEVVQMGIAVGHAPERLILMVPPEGCSAGVKIYSGWAGDLDKATELLSTSDVCSEVDRRRLIR